MSDDILNLANEVAETMDDANEAQASFTRELPMAGPCFLRFTQYIEYGQHENTYEGGKKKKKEPMAYFGFEIHGKNYPPIEFEKDGVKTLMPQRAGFKMPISRNDKANYHKLFVRMNVDGKAKAFPQLLSRGYKAVIDHFEIGPEGKKTKLVSLRNKEGYTIQPPVVKQAVMDDGVPTGEEISINIEDKIPKHIGDIRLFVWDASPAVIQKLWDCIYIEGQRESGEGDKKEVFSNNVWQERIIKALNFKGSAAENMLSSGGGVPDLPDATKGKDVAPAAPDDDPLNGVS